MYCNRESTQPKSGHESIVFLSDRQQIDRSYWESFPSITPSDLVFAAARMEQLEHLPCDRENTTLKLGHEVVGMSCPWDR
jgi:hypothetical protein